MIINKTFDQVLILTEDAITNRITHYASYLLPVDPVIVTFDAPEEHEYILCVKVNRYDDVKELYSIVVRSSYDHELYDIDEIENYDIDNLTNLVSSFLYSLPKQKRA